MNFNSQMTQFKQAQMRNLSQPIPQQAKSSQPKKMPPKKSFLPKKKHSTPFDLKYADPSPYNYGGIPQKKHQQQIQFAIINKMKVSLLDIIIFM